MPARRKPSPATYTPARLAGLSAHSEERSRKTVERLQNAIDKIKPTPVTLAAIERAGGPAWSTIKRNPKALALWAACKPSTPHRSNAKAQDPMLSCSRSELLAKCRQASSQIHELTAHLRAECEARATAESRYRTVLAAQLDKDKRIAELEADLARYEPYLSSIRARSSRQDQT